MKACRRLLITGQASQARCGDKVMANGRESLALCEECVHLNFPGKPAPNCQCPACLFERIGRKLQLTPDHMAAAAINALRRIHPNYDPSIAIMDHHDAMYDRVMEQITGKGEHRNG